jgi:hypothetical protein
MRRIAPALLTLALLTLAPAAQAEPVQQFSIGLTDIKPGGRFTVVFRANSFDTTGAPPPLVTENTVRMAKGLTIRKEFLNKDYWCRPDKLALALIAQDPGKRYTERLSNLAATLKRTRTKLRPGLEPFVKTCIRSQVGRGTVLADARPAFDDPAPANFFLYLAKPKAKNAVAGLGVLVVLAEDSPFYKNNPFLQTLRLDFLIDIFDEPTPDGRFGYKLVLPGGGAGGVRVSLAELEAKTTGLSKDQKRVTCLTKRKGRCVKRKVSTKKLFWLTQPACPATGQLPFESFYKYETGLTTTLGTQLPCPRFQL